MFISATRKIAEDDSERSDRLGFTARSLGYQIRAQILPGGAVVIPTDFIAIYVFN